MTTLTHQDRTAGPTDATAGPRTTLRALTGAGAVLFALGAILGPSMMFDSRPYSELSATPQHLVHYAVWAGCLIALSQIYPRLAGLGGPDGRRVSAVAATAAAVGAAADACVRFVLAFVNPYLAVHQPALLDTPPDAILLVPALVASVASMLGVIWLGASAWRARVFPRPAVLLLVIGAVTIPALGPLSNVLVGAALMWCAISASRRA